MIMKRLAYQFSVVLVAASACAQPSTTPSSPSPRPPWSALVTVLDESGRPVPGADVEVTYYTTPRPGQTEAGGRIQGPTDTNGVFRATHADTGSSTLGFRISKTGFYPSSLGRTLYEPGQFAQTAVTASRNIALTVALKGIAQPVAMYARRIDKGPPVCNEAIGYDLTVGDWIAPRGKGVHADIFFTKTSNLKSSTDYESTLRISFPNTGDGIQAFEVPAGPEEGSALRSPREAPEAGYQAILTKETSAHPGQPGKFDYDEKQNYFFRVHTVLDERGNVKSALYGKIYGDFMRFYYYLNPTPNDRNIEFNPQRNLLKGERVDAP